MGICWSIESGETKWESVEHYVKAWTAFCRADLCRDFCIPIDDEIYRFTRGRGGRVEVTHAPNPAVIAAIRKLKHDDAEYDEVNVLDSVSLFLPDDRGLRKVPPGTLPWEHHYADSLTRLRALEGHSPKRLMGQFVRAGALAESHSLIVGISYA
jgi:hypothetical protein